MPWTTVPGFIIRIRSDSNNDGQGDACIDCCGIFTDGFSGNTNCDSEGKLNLSDITTLIGVVYLSSPNLCCQENGNTNGDIDGKVNLADIVRLIDNVYLSHNETSRCL